MTVTAQPRQNSSNKPSYVYYDDWTGEIISVGHSIRNDCPAPFFKCDDADANDIISGVKSDKNYLVSVGTDNQAGLVMKSKYFRLSEKEHKLHLISETPLHTWDIRAIVYTTHAMLVIEINQEMVSRLVADHMRSTVSLSKDIDFKFYIIRKNRPDCLLKVVNINVTELVKTGSIATAIDDVHAFAGLTDIAIMTCRYFEHYYADVTTAEYVGKSTEAVHIDNDNKWQTVSVNQAGHLELVQTGNILEITSVVDAQKLTAVGMHHRHMNFYIVGDTPDKYHAQMSIDISKLRMGKPTKIIIDFDIMDMNIIYQHQQLKVNKRAIYDTDTN